MKKPKIRREDVPAGACLCEFCTGKCCRYLSLPIATPHTWSDYDRISWYLAHPQTLVYVDKGTWYLLVATRCKYLTADYRCRIYHTRPSVCQEYTTAECEYDEDWSFERVFETPEQILEYAAALLPARRSVRAGRATLPPAHTAGPHCCCFRVPIDRPQTWDDYDSIRWYLAHGLTVVHVTRGSWYLMVTTGGRGIARSDACVIDWRKALAPSKGRTVLGFRRPTGTELVFETPETLWEYAAGVLSPLQCPPRPEGSALPIVSLG